MSSLVHLAGNIAYTICFTPSYRSDNAGKTWTLLNDTDWALKT